MGETQQWWVGSPGGEAVCNQLPVWCCFGNVPLAWAFPWLEGTCALQEAEMQCG